MLKNTTWRYSGLSIGLHWLMVVLLIAVYVCMEVGEVFSDESRARELLKDWHFVLGLSVFALVWLRGLARFVAGPVPEVVPKLPRWQVRISSLMHFALYFWMMVMPIMGWLLLSAEGQFVNFFGVILPTIVAEDAVLAEWLEELHEMGATLGYVLLGVHTLAALGHHYIQKDNTLRRMLGMYR